MTIPRLTVFVPNYNHAAYVGDALKAILEQSWRAHEVIVVDDGSTDNSVEVIGQFARNDPSVIFLKNETNRGLHYSAKRASEIATGKYFYGAGADDRVLPGFFEKSLGMLAAYPQAGLCTSYFTMFDAQTGAISEGKMPWSNTPRYFTPDEFAALAPGGNLPGHATIVKKSAHVEVGGDREDLKWHCDWFALNMVAIKYGACFIPESLASMRTNLSTNYSCSGRSDWAQQRLVIRRIIDLILGPEFSELIPKLQRAQILSVFGPDVVRAIAENSANWAKTDIDTIAGMLGASLPSRLDFYLSPWLQSIGYSRLLLEQLTTKAIIDDPSNIEAERLRAHLMEESGRLLASAEGYARLHRCNPNDPHALLQLARFCLETGDLKHAEFFYSRLNAVQPDHPTAQSALVFIRKCCSAQQP